MKQEHIDWLVDSTSNVMDAIVTLEDDMSIADVGELLMYASMRYVLDSYKANPWSNTSTIYDAADLLKRSIDNVVDNARGRNTKDSLGK